jgi:hypothetical protein
MRKALFIYLIIPQNIFFVLCAQSCLEFKSTFTDVNMSVFVHQEASTSLQEMGINSSDTLGLFYNELCVGVKIVENNFFAFSLWGNDVNTETQDGLNTGEIPSSWLVKSEDNKIYHLIPEISEAQSSAGWQNDGILQIINFQLDFISSYGCQDPNYMEYWSLDSSPNCDDGSCSTAISSLLMNEFSVNTNSINSLNDSIVAQQITNSLINNFNDSISTINESLQGDIVELNSAIDDVSNMLSIQESENLDLTDSLYLNQLQILNLSNTIDTISTINESLQGVIVELNSTIDTVSNMLSIQESENLDLTDSLYFNQLQILNLSNTIDAISIINESLQEDIIELNSTITYFSNDNTSLYDSISTCGNELLSLNTTIDSLINPILIDLDEGWNMIGFSLLLPQGLVSSFEMIEDKITIVKNNDGNVYMSEYNFNGIGMLFPGEGYQLKTTEAINDFYFYPIY